MSRILPLPDSVFLPACKEAGMNLRTEEGRKAARLKLNELTNSNWTSSELIGGSLVVFRTANGMLSKEVHIPENWWR